MIKQLRIKFICIVMAIAMLMVSGILGVVIYFTGKNMQTQSLSMMRAIAASPFRQGNPQRPPDNEVRLPFFTVQISSRGELITADGGYFDLTDRDYLQQIVDLVLSERAESGELKEYNLRYLKVTSPRGYSIVFSDTATEAATLKNLVYSCLIIFVVAMLVFFGISVLLSRWTIKPVAKAWDQQRQFVADASHELKTPLSVIMANAELMQNEDAGEEDRRKFGANILSTTYQMRSLVESMLEMARVDNGVLKMKMTDLDFSQLTQDAVLSFQLLYEEKEQGLRCHIKEGIRLRGSEQHLYQVLDVLLDNALKYSTPHSMVSVDLSSYGRSCILSVCGRGEALSPEDCKQIFKRFYRGDKARSMNGSYGLGLSIAQSVVSAHKGKIWAESKNGYNIFYVRLPLA